MNQKLKLSRKKYCNFHEFLFHFIDELGAWSRRVKIGGDDSDYGK